jgi:ParB/RepB/Spo0J family partition protein
MDIDTPMGFQELKSSILKHGLLQPIIVRPARSRDTTNVTRSRSDVESNNRYEIICGHRRYLACLKLGLDSISAFVHDLDDRAALEVALIENLQRESLDPIEEAEAFKKYVINFGRGSITSLAARIGKSQVYVSHRLLLLGLPKPVIERISRRLLKPGQAIELVWLKDEQKQIELANVIISKNLSMRESRDAVKAIKDDKLTISNAVQRVTTRHRGPENSLDDESNQVEPWQDYESGNARQDDETRVLKHAELIIRTCLSGLDILVEGIEKRALKNAILNERQMVHDSLDRIIQARVIRRKRADFDI